MARRFCTYKKGTSVTRNPEQPKTGPENLPPEDDAPDVIDLAIERLKRGRPVALTADPDTLETLARLAEIQCTHAEAASVLGCSRVTFTNWLNKTDKARAIWDAGQETGRMSLRRKQFKMALAGNTVMCIWLGKQYLGQRDVVVQDVKMELSDGEAVKALRAEIDAMVPRLAPPGTTTG
jgi:hypothetical protein